MNMLEVSNPESEMFSFFELTPDLVCITGKDGFFRRVNPAVISKLGYTEAELFTTPVSTFIHPEDKEITRNRRAKLLQGKALLNFENRYITKKGKIIWLAWTSIYIPDKEIVFAIAKDITERKLLEREIEDKYRKYKSLATHFKTSLEVDRKYLAIELHEELAQLAAVIKMDIEWINTHQSDLSTDSKTRIDHAMGISELLINTIQRISFSISPNMLHDLGLNATLEWHCKEFSILNGIPCHLETAYEEESLSQEIKIDFFRICQESLTNVMNHAQASHVKICIEETATEISLTIEDDGKGFDLTNHAEMPGLISMRERAASINGRLEIDTKPGEGTVVRVTVLHPSGATRRVKKGENTDYL